MGAENIEFIWGFFRFFTEDETDQQFPGLGKSFPEGGDRNDRQTGRIGVADPDDGKIFRYAKLHFPCLALGFHGHGIGQRDECGRTFFLWKGKNLPD